MDKQQGNYLALSLDQVPSDVTVTVQFVNGLTTPDPVTLDPGDRVCVFRITDKTTQSVKMILEKNGTAIAKSYGLTGLTLESAE